jgi:hypothetical protein
LRFGRAHQPVRTNMWLGFKHKDLGGDEKSLLIF